MSKNSLYNEKNFNNFRNFFEWLQLESGQLRVFIQTPHGKKIYQEIHQAECATMIEMLLPVHRRITVVPKNKTGISMCSCMGARRCSENGEPVIFVCKEHQTMFGILECYWEDEVRFFLEHYNKNDIGTIFPQLPPFKRGQSDRNFLKDLGINPD